MKTIESRAEYHAKIGEYGNNKEIAFNSYIRGATEQQAIEQALNSEFEEWFDKHVRTHSYCVFYYIYNKNDDEVIECDTLKEVRQYWLTIKSKEK